MGFLRRIGTALAGPARRSGLLLTAAVGTLACGGDASGPNGGPEASFTIQIRGDVSRDVTGAGAAFGPRTEPTVGTVWSVRLTFGEAPRVEALEFLRRDGRPAVGEYALSDAELPTLIPPGGMAAFLVLQPVDAVPPGFTGSSTGGTLSVEGSSEDVVRGTFTFPAAGNVFPFGGSAQPGTLTVSGSFMAVRGDP